MNKLTYPKHHVVVIGTPLVSVSEIGLSCCPNNTIHTEERFLPNILVQLKIFASKSEVKKNRPELSKHLEKMDLCTLKFGHRVVDIVVGE